MNLDYLLKIINMKNLFLHVEEPSFGASTAGFLFVDGDQVVSFYDVSSGLTNYAWDGWNDWNPVGLPVDEVMNQLNDWFIDFEDQFRRPFVVIEEVPIEETMMALAIA